MEPLEFSFLPVAAINMIRTSDYGDGSSFVFLRREPGRISFFGSQYSFSIHVSLSIYISPPRSQKMRGSLPPLWNPL